MQTTHKIFFKNSAEMSKLGSNTIDLMVTSPPYPMIEMWDSLFSNMNGNIKVALQKGDAMKAYKMMHLELDKTWKQVARVLKPGGIACINIGDATRNISQNFQLFPNHIEIIKCFQKKGFISLPCVLWRKPTNSPNKFLGSGMLPSNAYVSLEHEYILFFRKGINLRKFPPKSDYRYKSAYFWEERNTWFSDVWWDITGTNQKIDEGNVDQLQLRKRSAAFPILIPYRIINMYSIHGDTIMDPFWGTGTTTLAAMISGRNSIGFELDEQFLDIFKRRVLHVKSASNSINQTRLKEHLEFIKMYEKKKKSIKHSSVYYKFPVMTKQEEDILFYSIKQIEEKTGEYHIFHQKINLEF